ncbi:MAG: amidohydrolase family protein [Alphaproteobacteria bacterium]
MIALDDLVDHHCHGVVPGDLDRRGFEALFSEARLPHAPGFSQFDKPLGLMIRRHCAPVLDLEPHAEPEAYVARRRALGAEEVGRRLLRGAGLSAMLIDTGHRSDAILGVEAMGRLAATAAWEVVRIEAVMEAAARAGGDAASLLDRFAATLDADAAGAVGLKSIVSYRAAFDLDPSRPSRHDAQRATEDWLRANEAGGWRRLESPVLLRWGLWQGLDICASRKLPLQLHVGFGDRDIVMHRCDPTVFTAFIEAAEEAGVAICLLHCYPFEREAAWMAEVFSNVYYDVGATLNYTGASARRVMADALEMGPFTKQLFSSDAFGLPELYYLGRLQFERTLGAILDDWIAAGDCTARDAERIAAMIAGGNARRIYPIPACA